MESTPLDRFMRILAKGAQRRTAIAGLIGSAMTALASRFAADEIGARKKKRKRKKKKKSKNKNQGNGAIPPPPVPPSPLPPPPPAPFTQTCPGPANNAQFNHRRFAQTFTAERGGQLTNATCGVFVEAPVDFTVQIRPLDGSGAPVAAILASATAAANGETTLSAVFDPPAPVETGVGYALVVTGVQGQSFILRSRDGDPCSGQLFRDTQANDTFVSIAGIDMVYSVTVSV